LGGHATNEIDCSSTSSGGHCQTQSWANVGRIDQARNHKAEAAAAAAAVLFWKPFANKSQQLSVPFKENMEEADEIRCCFTSSGCCQI
jgi:hypothetical protein